MARAGAPVGELYEVVIDSRWSAVELFTAERRNRPDKYRAISGDAGCRIRGDRVLNVVDVRRMCRPAEI